MSLCSFAFGACFARVHVFAQVKNPRKKNTSKKKTVIFLGIMDDKPFEAALRTYVMFAGYMQCRP